MVNFSNSKKIKYQQSNKAPVVWVFLAGKKEHQQSTCNRINKNQKFNLGAGTLLARK